MPFPNIDSSVLFASVLWGGVGTGYLVYGWKQRSGPALCCGVAMMGVSYVIGSALWMSVASIALIAVTYFWSKRSD